MQISRIILKKFRNYTEESIDLTSAINVFLGQNAQGKTNIIEAVHYAALGKSHRTSQDAELLQWQEEAGSVQLEFSRLSINSKLEFLFTRGHRRRIRFNGSPIRTKELMGLINAVLFSPEDLFLIKGSPAGRRRFLDTEISQASPSYYHELVTYQHLLAQRNTLLKNIRDHGAARSQLSFWDDQLVRSAAHITVKRLEAVKKLALLAGARHQVISDGREALSIRYELHGQTEKMMTNELPSWYNKRLAERQELDIMRGVTSVGPHRDDLCFMVDGVDLKAYGSQGQQRTGVLSLKLAELEFLRSETGEYPVLLLDDVMSELDADRRAKLLQFIRDEGIQTLITATDEAYFPAERIGAYYQVTAGKVRRLA